VFHANDIKETSKKIQLMKRMNIWYMNNALFHNLTHKKLESSASASNVTTLLLKTNKKKTKFSIVKHSRGKSSETLCQSHSFYIYDWPIEHIDIISSVSSKKMAKSFNSLEKNVRDRDEEDVLLLQSRRENFGAGNLLDEESGQFNTYMHSLFPIVYQRLLLHPLRTLDANSACLFFIPYDITSDSYYANGQHLNFVYEQLITKSSHFNNSFGSDHFFIDSSEPFWYEKKTVVSTFYKLCDRCMKLTPSTLHVPFQKWQFNFNIDDSYIHIPYTSTWHYFETTHDQPHLGARRSPSVTTSGQSSATNTNTDIPNKTWAWEFNPYERRQNLICFVGIIKKMSQSATQLRRLLAFQCQKASVFPNLTSSSSASLTSALNQSGLIPSISLNNADQDLYKYHTKNCKSKILSKSSWKNFGDEARLYRNTTFCLLPTGDIPSRKALFDMLIVGCIPVIFDKRQISIYQWHLNQSELENFHIFFDLKTVLKEKLNVVEILNNIRWGQIIRMRRAIKHVAFSLQYSLSPICHINCERNFITPVNATVYRQWKPPNDDALEIILRKLFNFKSELH
jgi:hypothetical protein